MANEVNNVNGKPNVVFKITEWIGTPYSLMLHTMLFVGIFSLKFINFSIDDILLILTTAVSLEAIYLAIFIQMTVNRNTASLESVEDDIEDIQEDVKGLEEDIDEIQAEEDSQSDEDEQTKQALTNIALEIKRVQTDLDLLKKRGVI